ncbi:hypothetical protein ACFSTG_04695 [Salinimicrobium flavum]|uniref:Uncharacterized protein n=2 Tax=Salinimicrobium flavum TaxID=1737065 RepID=A0ABW5IW88_9FLAO
METLKSLMMFLPGKLLCPFLGHRLQVSKLITDHIKEYKCCRCGEEMTDTAQGLLEKLTPKFRETNAFLANYYERRRNRKVFSEAS